MNGFVDNVDAWNYLRALCKLHGYQQYVEHGSTENEQFTYRLQAFPLSIMIKFPSEFLYLPKHITVGMIEKYYNEYLISPDHPGGEDYSYGERINPQIEPVFELLRLTPATNQAIIDISRPEDINLVYPPCLRTIQFMMFNDMLNVITYWRSNDIGEAFLLNQGGIGLFLQEASDYSGIPAGGHYYYSPGAHIYERKQTI